MSQHTPAPRLDGRDVLLFQDAEGWGVALRGRHVVRGETYAVAAAVEWALRDGATGTTEADEVARAILAAEGATNG